MTLAPNSLPQHETIRAHLRDAVDHLSLAAERSQLCDDGTYLAGPLSDLIGGLQQAVHAIADHLMEDYDQ